MQVIIIINELGEIDQWMSLSENYIQMIVINEYWKIMKHSFFKKKN